MGYDRMLYCGVATWRVFFIGNVFSAKDYSVGLVKGCCYRCFGCFLAFHPYMFFQMFFLLLVSRASHTKNHVTIVTNMIGVDISIKQLVIQEFAECFATVSQAFLNI